MTNPRLVENSIPTETVHSRLIENILNLAYVVKHTESRDPVALFALEQGYKLVDANVGVDGEARFGRVPLPVLSELHDAAIENHLASKPISDLAEKLWRRVNFGRAPHWLRRERIEHS